MLTKYRRAQPLPLGYPWADATADKTNPYTEAPNTGVIRSYDFVISRGFIAPDGVNKSAILVNNVFPGKMISSSQVV